MWNCNLKENLNLILQWRPYSNYQNIPDSDEPPCTCHGCIILETIMVLVLIMYKFCLFQGFEWCKFLLSNFAWIAFRILKWKVFVSQEIPWDNFAYEYDSNSVIQTFAKAAKKVRINKYGANIASWLISESSKFRLSSLLTLFISTLGDTKRPPFWPSVQKTAH